MESLTLMSFVAILRETLKIFSKNGRLMALIALLIILIKSSLFVSNIFSIKPVITDYFFERNVLLPFSTPNTPEFNKILTHIRKDIKIIFGIEIIYVIIDSVAFILSITATILVAAITHGGKNDDLSFKDVMLKTVRSWTRPLITCNNPSILTVAAILMGVSAVVFYIYLSVTWFLAIVVSVAEQKRGLEAIGKAAEIVKDMKLQGFLLNLAFSISSVIFVQGIEMIPVSHSLVARTIILLVEMNCAIVVRMYWFSSFTVFYYRCKKTHGEGVELEGVSSDGYSKIPATAAPLVGDNIP
ncbi:uncharacterized protein LOC110600532 [Manihot esculenta]|uniref:uncharacterized protein LOC110600532 n=1 Tax=Manihot esculenta TaxID=3983 RepID=UPI000B5D4BBD|nr:uncharacterized protein LOC110600532 [Manihot esculenta]